MFERFHDDWNHAIPTVTVMAGPVPAITISIGAATDGRDKPAMTQGVTIDVPVILKRL
jgi:hypothetical protein